MIERRHGQGKQRRVANHFLAILEIAALVQALFDDLVVHLHVLFRNSLLDGLLERRVVADIEVLALLDGPAGVLIGRQALDGAREQLRLLVILAMVSSIRTLGCGAAVGRRGASRAGRKDGLELTRRLQALLLFVDGVERVRGPSGGGQCKCGQILASAGGVGVGGSIGANGCMAMGISIVGWGKDAANALLLVESDSLRGQVGDGVRMGGAPYWWCHVEPGTHWLPADPKGLHGLERGG